MNSKVLLMSRNWCHMFTFPHAAQGEEKITTAYSTIALWKSKACGEAFCMCRCGDWQNVFSLVWEYQAYFWFNRELLRALETEVGGWGHQRMNAFITLIYFSLQFFSSILFSTLFPPPPSQPTFLHLAFAATPPAPLVSDCIHQPAPPLLLCLFLFVPALLWFSLAACFINRPTKAFCIFFTDYPILATVGELQTEEACWNCQIKTNREVSDIAPTQSTYEHKKACIKCLRLHIVSLWGNSLTRSQCILLRAVVPGKASLPGFVSRGLTVKQGLLGH